MVSRSMPNCREGANYSAKTKNLSGTAQPCKHPCWNDRRNLTIPLVTITTVQWAGKHGSAVAICCSVNATGIKRIMDDVLWPVFHVPWIFVALTLEPWCRDDFMAKKMGTTRSQDRPNNCISNFEGDRPYDESLLTSQSASIFFLPYQSPHASVRKMCRFWGDWNILTKHDVTDEIDRPCLAAHSLQQLAAHSLQRLF